MKSPLFCSGNVQVPAAAQRGLRRLAQSAAMALVLAGSGCHLLNPAPNDADALVAVRGIMGEAGISLPQNFQLSNVHIVSCVWQESPDGHVCNVTVVSTELPIIGAVSLPMSFRFAKREGSWKAFIL
jgi:hypothetical protein